MWARRTGVSTHPFDEDTSVDPQDPPPVVSATSVSTPSDGGVIAPRHDAAAEGEDDTLCVVCMDQPTTHTVQPCGHKVVCRACAERLRNDGGSNCVICRGTVTHYEGPDGALLERKSAASNSPSMFSRFEFASGDRVWLAMLLCLFVSSPIVAVVLANLNHKEGHKSLVGLTLHIGLAMSSVIWVITAALSTRCLMSSGTMVPWLSGGASAFLIPGMWVMVLVASAMPSSAAGLAIFLGFFAAGFVTMFGWAIGGAVQGCVTKVSSLLLESWKGGALRTGCVVAAIGFCLNPPLHIAIACRYADEAKSMDACGGLLGMLAVVWSLVVWAVTLAVLRVALYYHPELPEQDLVAVEQPVGAPVAAEQQPHGREGGDGTGAPSAPAAATVVEVIGDDEGDDERAEDEPNSHDVVFNESLHHAGGVFD